MNREQFDILLVVLIAAGLILSNTAGRGRPPVKFFARGAVWALCGVLAYEKALWAAVLKAPTADYLDLVSANEVDLWRKDRHEFLRHSRQMQPARHITLPQAQTFVQEAGQGLARELTDSGAGQAVLDAREVL